MAFDRNEKSDEAFGHKPVLLDECLDGLAIRPDGVYLDGTLGRAGHSLEIARRLGPKGRLIGVDRDETAIAAAKERLAEFSDRVTLVQDNFSNLTAILQELGLSGVDGMLFDLGVSSPQLDDAGRGFSYMHDAPLDMRMDRTAGLSARDVVNSWSYEELRRILYEYGEERYAPAIAKGIVNARQEKEIQTTLELVEIIKRAMPAPALREKQHPAKRSFQAIRIAVNDELGALPVMLRAAAEGLNDGGRLAVISFHSLEDRIVKRTMQELATGCTCPPEFPVCVCGKKPKLKLITRKPVVAGSAELLYNPRSRSAKLRVAERCRR
jgi:16S rRNA (cytosine1402-N4)-methyltransferase